MNTEAATNTSAAPAEPAPVIAAPAPAIEYEQIPQREWPWDVRVVLWVGIVYSGLQLAQSATGTLGIVRQTGISWFRNGFGGWQSVLRIALGSLLPLLLMLGLLGMRHFRPGSRRLALTVTGVMILFGAIEMVISIVTPLAGNRYHADLLPMFIVGTFQQFVAGYGVLIVILLSLARADMRADVHRATPG